MEIQRTSQRRTKARHGGTRVVAQLSVWVGHSCLLIAREELCHLAELGVAGGDQFLRCASLQFGQLFFERAAEQGGGGR